MLKGLGLCLGFANAKAAFIDGCELKDVHSGAAYSSTASSGAVPGISGVSKIDLSVLSLKPRSPAAG